MSSRPECEVSIRRLPPQSMTLVQVPAGDAVDMRALSGTLPILPDASSGDGGSWICELGQGEWLVMGKPTEAIETRVHHVLSPGLARVSDVSAGYATLRVEGRGARRLLGTDIGGPQGLQDAGPGDHLRTRLAQVTVLMKCVKFDAFDLYVDRSLATYLAGWLTDQAARLDSRQPVAGS